MSSPYGGIFPLLTSRELQRIYEILDECFPGGGIYMTKEGDVGEVLPDWYEDEYNGNVNSMPPKVLLKFMDHIIERWGPEITRDIRQGFNPYVKAYDKMYGYGGLLWDRADQGDVKTIYGDEYFDLSFYEAKEKRIGEATERVRRHKQCFLDLKRIRGNLVEKMRRWNI